MTNGTAARSAYLQLCPDSLLVPLLGQLAATTSIDQLCVLCQRCFEEIFLVDCLDILLYEPSRETLKRYAGKALLPFHVDAEVAAGSSPAGHVWETQAIIRATPELPSTLAKAARELHNRRIHSFALLPLSTTRSRFGVLAIGSTRGRLLPEQIEWTVKVLCGHLASDIERILALENLQKVLLERDRAKVLFAVAQALAKPCELAELFVEISTILRPFLQPDYVGLALCERDSSQLRLSVMDFPGGKGVLREERLIPGGPSCRAFHSGEPILITSLAESKVPFDLSKLLLTEGLNSACFIPLGGAGEFLGMLGFGSVRANAFSQHHADALSELAPCLGLAIENAQAVQRLARVRGNPHPGRSDRSGRTSSQTRPIIGSDTGLREVFETIETIASTDATVLLLGETGTGKELLARAVHDLSGRHDKNFVTVNCAAIPAGLLESDLFGHEKGAFTGALAARFGRFELAHLGTLFLDEVGDIPLELQPKLLRVLQESEFERLGSARTLRVDVRIVAATHRDLLQMTRDGRFRSDLFYRLNVIPVRVPALRERSADIPMLVAHFIGKYAKKFRRQVDSVAPATLDTLRRWPWPGNVRELENLIERAVALSTGPLLELPASELSEQDGNRLKSAENEIIRCTLRETNGIIGGPNGAAARLGMKRSTLQSKLKRLTW